MEEIIYKPLIAGIDTLEIGYCIARYQLSQEEWEMLKEAKERAQSGLLPENWSRRSDTFVG